MHQISNFIWPLGAQAAGCYQMNVFWYTVS